jgi:nucleotidyltransferase substrate binding protein (TIGR01987 family)
MSVKDIRWIQRFHNFGKALAQLAEAVDLAKQREFSKLEKRGVIQSFEFTHELAWNTLKDFLENRGAQDLYGSKDATREAFKAGLIYSASRFPISCKTFIKFIGLESTTFSSAR